MNQLLQMLGSGAVAPLTYAEDVFSAYTYTGNSSTQTITNGIDLAGKGGVVWVKNRGAVADNLIVDSALNGLVTNTTASQVGSGFTSFNSNGYSMNSVAATQNLNANTYVSWTFRKAPKFFDVVTYTGNGVSDRNIAHSLGIAPGMVIVKCTSTTGAWGVYHKDLGTYAADATKNVYLNTTAAETNSGLFRTTGTTSTTFSVSADAIVNTNGATYVAYLFAHDTSADGLIQCGSFTTDGSGNATVNLGWEPQFLLVKKSSTTSSWGMYDASRGWIVDANKSAALYANFSQAENANGGELNPTITSTGFKINPGTAAAETSIYLAIRRPNKPPTTGTQVYQAIARTGTGAAATVTGVGFAPDLVAIKSRSAATENLFCDRLRGTASQLVSNTTAAQSTSVNVVTAYGMDGASLGYDAFINSNNNGNTYINWFFKRAPGVFDVVCYTGTGSNLTVTHGLGAVPEMMIVKARSSGGWNWAVYEASQGATKRGLLNSTAGFGTSTPMWNNTAPTLTTFTVGAGDDSNPSAGVTMVAYLFATKAGVSKVFSFTGNGSSQTINCGFTTGARWVMIKRADSAGDWYVWDSTRGIIAGNDPHLSLNTVAAEVTTDDSVDADTTGFIVNQLSATNVNVNASAYIGLAFA